MNGRAVFLELLRIVDFDNVFIDAFLRLRVRRVGVCVLCLLARPNSSFLLLLLVPFFFVYVFVFFASDLRLRILGGCCICSVGWFERPRFDCCSGNYIT